MHIPHHRVLSAYIVPHTPYGFRAAESVYHFSGAFFRTHVVRYASRRLLSCLVRNKKQLSAIACTPTRLPVSCTIQKRLYTFVLLCSFARKPKSFQIKCMSCVLQKCGADSRLHRRLNVAFVCSVLNNGVCGETSIVRIKRSSFHAFCSVNVFSAHYLKNEKTQKTQKTHRETRRK